MDAFFATMPGDVTFIKAIERRNSLVSITIHSVHDEWEQN